MHWEPRGPDESTSSFGQWIHDKLPNTFWLVDDDIRPNHWSIRKLKSRIYREIEHKWRGQPVKPSEQDVMVLRAIGIQHLIAEGYISPFSGAFVFWSDAPFISAVAEKVAADGSYGLPIRLHGEQVKQFVGCWGSTEFMQEADS